MCALDGWDWFCLINWTSSSEKPVIHPARPRCSLVKAHDELTIICQFSEGTTTTRQRGNDQDGSAVIRWRSQAGIVDRCSCKGNRMWLKDIELAQFHTVKTNKKTVKTKIDIPAFKSPYCCLVFFFLLKWHAQHFIPLIKLTLFLTAADLVGLISWKITKMELMWHTHHSSALDTNCLLSLKEQLSALWSHVIKTEKRDI